MPALNLTIFYVMLKIRSKLGTKTQNFIIQNCQFMTTTYVTLFENMVSSENYPAILYYLSTKYLSTKSQNLAALVHIFQILVVRFHGDIIAVACNLSIESIAPPLQRLKYYVLKSLQ